MVTKLLIQASDEMLVDQARSGSLEAFESLYERYHSRLLNYCSLLVGDNTVAEGILRESFVRFYKQLPRYRFQEKVGLILFRFATQLSVQAQNRSTLPFESWIPSPKFFFLRELPLTDRALFLLSEAYGFEANQLETVFASQKDVVRSRVSELREKVPVNWKEEWDHGVVRTNGNSAGSSEKERLRPYLEEAESAARLKRILLVATGVVVAVGVLFWGRLMLRAPVSSDLTKGVFNPLELELKTVHDPERMVLKHFTHQDAERGRVLRLEYRFLKGFASGEFTLALNGKREMSAESFSVRLKRTKSGEFPEAFVIELRGSGQTVTKRTIRNLSEEWTTVEFPIRSSRNLSVNEVGLIFDSEMVGSNRGQILVTEVVLQNKPEASL